jgi:micrococcal nuclease
MRHAFLVVLLISAVSDARDKKPKAPAQDDDEAETPKKKKGHSAQGTLQVNGQQTFVRWTDGDSFKFKSGPFDGRGTRLVGYNTLEAYGPVHRWGEWTAKELFALAERSSTVAASKEWACTTDGKVDGYGRVLVDCPDLAVEMARAGHGLAYSVDGKANEKVLEAQAEAMKNKVGMWEKGAVKGVITSLHSVGEDGDAKDTAYNRVVDTRTGEALGRQHQHHYGLCEEVCETTDGDVSCMTYVPFERRYKNKPACLKD